VTIRICSVAGETVETLEDGYRTQGVHELRWTPDGIASGMYLCVMQAGGFRDVRKMIYQK
jgi:hypothetical protein